MFLKKIEKFVHICKESKVSWRVCKTVLFVNIRKVIIATFSYKTIRQKLSADLIGSLCN